MAWLTIPTTADVPHHSIQVELDGAAYALVFQWNAREGYWYAHLYNDDESISIRAGRKVTIDWTLFPDDLPGLLMAIYPEGLQGVQDDLAQLTLYYAEQDTVAAIAEGA